MKEGKKRKRYLKQCCRRFDTMKPLQPIKKRRWRSERPQSLCHQRLVNQHIRVAVTSKSLRLSTYSVTNRPILNAIRPTCLQQFHRSKRTMTSFPHTKLTLPNIRGTARNARTGFVCFFTIFPSLKKTIYLAFVITYHRCLLFQQPKTTAFILRSYHLDDNKDNIWTSRQALDVRQNDAHGDNNNKKRWTCYSEAEKK